eukprot:366545-Chlamydomonas_euryale.AAC.1
MALMASGPYYCHTSAGMQADRQAGRQELCGQVALCWCSNLTEACCNQCDACGCWACLEAVLSETGNGNGNGNGHGNGNGNFLGAETETVYNISESKP